MLLFDPPIAAQFFDVVKIFGSSKKLFQNMHSAVIAVVWFILNIIIIILKIKLDN